MCFPRKASEGIDFTDKLARLVILLGIPYPQFKDPPIVVKKLYNNRDKIYPGKIWYKDQAFRPVNQTIGISIRNTKDWASIFLLDIRYSQDLIKNRLSKWIKENLKIYPKYSDNCKKDLKISFNHVQIILIRLQV